MIENKLCTCLQENLMDVTLWSSSIVSTLAIAAAMCCVHEQSYVPLVLILGGLACNPIVGKLIELAARLAQQASISNVLLKELLPIFLCTILLSMLFAVSCDRPISLSCSTMQWVVVGSLAAGIVGALGIPVAPHFLGAVVVIPLVSLGLWMGSMVRGHSVDNEEDMPSNMTLSFALGMLILAFAAWGVFVLKAPTPSPSVMPTKVPASAPPSPVFGSLVSEAPTASSLSEASNYYYDDTMDQRHLQSLLPY